MSNLSAGLIFRIATDAAIELRGKGDKRYCCCPFHDDRHASAFVSADNVFYCSVCTPGRGLSAKQFCERKGLDWSRYWGGGAYGTQAHPARQPEPTFTATDAALVWKAAYARARDDTAIEADRELYDFLISRGLMEASEYGVYGIIPDGVSLPGDVSTWRRRGYGLIAPLFDSEGRLACIQSRSVRGGEPRTRFPSGSRAAGTVFADERGLAVLRGTAPTTDAVVYGEGLTDFLALSVASPAAVLCAPGTSMAVAGVGPWARGLLVWLAIDCDAAGRLVRRKVSDALYHAGAHRVASVAWPHPAKDACDVVAERGTGGLHHFLSALVAKAGL